MKLRLRSSGGFGPRTQSTSSWSARGQSGLMQVRDILQNIPDISFCDLTGKDVVRHKLVQRIVTAYGAHEEAKAQPDRG